MSMNTNFSDDFGDLDDIVMLWCVMSIRVILQHYLWF